jgi:glycine cleavage system H protein
VTEFLETTHDKFVFTVKVGYLYNREDFWAAVDGVVAKVGLTDFLQKSTGDVAFLETIEIGAEVKQGQELGRIETIKATFDVISPVTGRVIEVNPEMETSPFLINQDPYGDGWIYKIELTSFHKDRGQLLEADAYFELMKEKISKVMDEKHD